MDRSYLVPEINRDNSTVKSDPNVLSGFKQSAKNGQSRLALDYLVYIVDILVGKVEALEAEVTRLSSMEEPTKEVKTKAAKVTSEEV
jgi:hypothetical protein